MSNSGSCWKSLLFNTSNFASRSATASTLAVVTGSLSDLKHYRFKISIKLWINNLL